MTAMTATTAQPITQAASAKKTRSKRVQLSVWIIMLPDPKHRLPKYLEQFYWYLCYVSQQNGVCCDWTNKQLGSKLKVHYKTISRWVSALNDAGHISIGDKPGRERVLYPEVKPVIWGASELWGQMRQRIGEAADKFSGLVRRPRKGESVEPLAEPMEQPQAEENTLIPAPISPPENTNEPDGQDIQCGGFAEGSAEGLLQVNSGSPLVNIYKPFSKQKSAESASPSEVEAVACSLHPVAVVVALMENGILPQKAAEETLEAARKHRPDDPEGYCYEQIEALNYRKSDRNRAGLLRASIEDGYGLPDALVMKREREREEQETRERRAREAQIKRERLVQEAKEKAEQQQRQIEEQRAQRKTALDSVEARLREAWPTILAKLRENVNKPTYETHFLPALPIADQLSGPDVVTIGLHSDFSKEWVQKRHLSLLREVLQEALGRTITLRLTLLPKE